MFKSGSHCKFPFLTLEELLKLKSKSPPNVTTILSSKKLLPTLKFTLDLLMPAFATLLLIPDAAPKSSVLLYKDVPTSKRKLLSPVSLYSMLENILLISLVRI